MQRAPREVKLSHTCFHCDPQLQLVFLPIHQIPEVSSNLLCQHLSLGRKLTFGSPPKPTAAVQPISGPCNFRHTVHWDNTDFSQFAQSTPVSCSPLLFYLDENKPLINGLFCTRRRGAILKAFQVNNIHLGIPLLRIRLWE